MAESLLLPWVQGLVGQAADALVQRVTSMWGVDDYRRKLEDQLVYVRSLLADSEEKAEVKTEAGRAIKVWMKKLKAAAYEADDVLDDFRYEALRREAQQAEESMSRKVLYFSRDKIVFSHKASRDLKNVLDKIDELVAEMNTFGLLQRAEAPKVVYQQTCSVLDEPLDIFGRDNDKEVVVKLLLDQKDQQNVQVLPIIGMGGLGKTTLAKMVFNDDRVDNHFELKIWYCVSDNFEATAILRSLIQLATSGSCGLSDNIEMLRGKLLEAIGRKRFLLVLDDVWSEEQHKWEDNLKPLLCSSSGGSGSMIVVTSRSNRVASIMGTLPPHELTCLGEDDSWKLFSKKAFSKGVQEQPEFVIIGKSITNSCKGLPLALKTMGGLMSSRLKVQEWKDIAKSNLGEAKDQVLSILKLSYRHLSPDMKQCFAFGAVFPKDYEMEKDQLLQLWIANGFILEEETMDLMQKAECIFSELAWRSFLQDVNVSFDHRLGVRKTVCKMHDLMHDLAKDISSVECVNAIMVPKREEAADVLHMQISYSGWVEFNRLLRSASALRTLLITGSRQLNFKNLKAMPLRALCCQDPSFIHCQYVNPAHLRYLDLSNSDIDRLPDAVCMFYNLISLRLNGCKKLRCLPEGMASLRKLRHLYLLRCCNLERMPPKLSLLQDLCILTMFVVGTEDGCGIEELRDLRQLSHKLELCKLRNVKTGSVANLHEKRINELLLDWDHKKNDILTNDEANKEAEVLESLEPPSELEFLKIRGYHGLAISQWMRDPEKFRCLRELIISNCPKCQDIPVVWQSSSLEHVSLSGMDSLTTLCKNIEEEAAEIKSPQVFSRLKRMELYNLPNLESWIESSAGESHKSVMFPQLEELTVDGCSKLATLPEATLLTHLTCWGSESADVRPMSMPLGRWPSLVRLRLGLLANVSISLEGQQGQIQTPLENLRTMEVVGEDAFISLFDLPKLRLGLGDGLACLEVLEIRSCCKIVRWPVEELRYLRRLRSLSISGFEKLERISSEDMLSLPLLETLDIRFCDSLREIQELPASLERVEITTCERLVALPSNLGNLARLRVLRLSKCGGMETLPDGMDGLTSLEELMIWGCSRIVELPPGLLLRLPHLKRLLLFGSSDGLKRCCREGGEYFDLLSSIPFKNID
ncbi:hypothetical protein U9M48_037966 [Paspalum notatum var. saurae]|uniref:Disease resistance protein RGA3 n=1 Tax=Paspalum notatum var. saurae TaxID=547442 RepID=A0AAQ3UG40_PASNO